MEEMKRAARMAMVMGELVGEKRTKLILSNSSSSSSTLSGSP